MCTTFIKYFVHSGNIVATEEMFDISAFLLSVSNKKGKLCLFVHGYYLKGENAINNNKKSDSYESETVGLCSKYKNEICTKTNSKRMTSS